MMCRMLFNVAEDTSKWIVVGKPKSCCSAHKPLYI